MITKIRPVDLFPKKTIRNSIQAFENMLKQRGGQIGDQDDCPLKHTYTDGMYVREIFIPKGKYLVGKIHRHSHPNFLLKGKVRVITEDQGSQILTAPLSIVSPAGTKRVVFAEEDTVWVTVHINKNNSRDPHEIEKDVIVENYDKLEEDRQ